MESELERILLPEKMAKAEFNIKKLAYDSKLLELTHRAETADLDNRMRVIASGGRSAASGPDGGQTNAGGGRYGGRVADIVKSFQGGAAVPSSGGGGGGGKILGTGLNP